MPEETTPKAKPAKRGRPKGSKNTRPDLVPATPSHCRTCGSTDREPYHKTTVQQFGGIHEGRPYTHIVRRWTACKACGQARVDITHENRPPAP